MKVAGSSWSPWRLPLHVLVAVSVLVAFVTPTDSQCKLLDTDNSQQFEHEENLIEELAIASEKTGKVPTLLDDLLKPYDATPFWYNLIQAIAMATGISPTTEVLMHDLVTSSFKGDNLFGSIKQVLTNIKCNESKNDDIPEMPTEDENHVGDRTDSTNVLKVVPEIDLSEKTSPEANPEAVPADEWSPWQRVLATAWDREQEVHGNSLSELVSLPRLRRELRDRKRSSANADLHQPFFMSEVVPSSLVTRHPSIISISGCPSGHIQDLRGVCRQIFQYTVNYGGGRPAESDPASRRGFGSFGSKRPPWQFSHASAQSRPGSLRDIARESSLFKHSVLRGYIPPFIFSNDFLQSSRPNSEVRNNKALTENNNTKLPAAATPIQPSPVDVSSPTFVVIQDSSKPAFEFSDAASKIRKSENKSRKNDDSNHGSRGSSEIFDHSSGNSRDEKKKKNGEEENNKEKLRTTTSSSSDDDD